MLDFESEFAVAAPKLESLPTLSHDDQIGSLNISTPYQSPWINPTSSSSSSSSLDSVLFEQRPLDLSDMETLINHIGSMDSWGMLDQTHETSTSKVLKTVSMPSSEVFDPQLDILNVFMKKCSSTEDAYVKACTPHGNFLPDVRSVNFIPEYNLGQVIQEDLYGSLHSEPNLKLAEIESKNDVLKIPAKRSIGARPTQHRPTKKVAQHHQSGAKEISQREIHIQSERERRKGMNNLFEKMRSLLPNPIQKVDKSTIVSEIINYIQSLQQDLEDLNKKKAILTASPKGGPTHMTKTEPSCAESIQSECTESDSIKSLPLSEDQCSRQTSHLTLHFTENDIFITVCCLQKLNILPSIIFVIEDHNLQIISANVSTTDTVAFHCIHAKALETPDMTTKQSLKSALKNFVCSDKQIRFE